MKIEERIVSDLAYDLKEKINSILIEELKYTTKSYYLDERGEPLETLWEEFCVIVQDGGTITDIKEQIEKDIKDKVSKKFDSLSYYKKIALWLKTNSGVAWLEKNRDECCTLDSVPVHFSDCKDTFYELLEKEASSFENNNISRFMNMELESFKKEFDEDAKESVYE